MGDRRKKLAAALKEFAVCAMIVAVPSVLFSCVLALAHIDGRSMEPGFHDGDTVICSRLSDISRGDVFLFKSPDGSIFIKRAVALPGDSIEVHGGQAYVNGEPLDEDYVSTELGTGPDFEIGTVPEGSVFALGDNRGASKDSRDPEIGFVSSDDIVGRLLLHFGKGALD